MPGVEQEPMRLVQHEVILIAAVARNGVIGRDGGLPWTLPGDLAYFRRKTVGHPVIMGRRTYEQIGHPLRDRSTIVLSADKGFAPTGSLVARTLSEAFAAADSVATETGAGAIMVAGGGAVYAATIGHADRLLLTLIDAEPRGDTVFPDLDPQVWSEAEREMPTRQTGDTSPYSFTRWERTHSTT